MVSKHVERACVLGTIVLSWAAVATFSILLPGHKQSRLLQPEFVDGAAALHGVYASSDDERLLDEMPPGDDLASASHSALPTTGVTTLIVDDHPLAPALSEQAD